MKNLIIIVISALFFVSPVFAAEGVINVPSNFNVEKTAHRMKNILQQKKMTLFNQINHSDGAAKAGVMLRETVLLIFGNPKVGSPLMQCRQSMAIDLPQKALIWEDEKSQVWISYNDPGYLQKRHNISGCENVISKIEKALAGITKAAAGN